MKKTGAVVLAAVSLAACQTSHAQKPVPMSNKGMQLFADWAAYPHAKAFAVSTNGAAMGVIYCPEFGGCAGDVESQALAYCEAGSKGVPCVIYGLNGKPIVDDPKLTAYLATHKGERSFDFKNTSRKRTQTDVKKPAVE